MHANQMSFNQCRYQSRALSASPSPPPIPPQPNHIQYSQQLQTSFDVPPPPPPRCYHLVPIRNKNQFSTQSPRLYSFGNSSFDRNSFSRNNYENVQELKKPSFVVKDPRRKPYYYNELSQNFDANESIDILDTKVTQDSNNNKSEFIENVPNNDELNRSSSVRASLVNAYGSGGSLDHIF